MRERNVIHYDLHRGQEKASLSVCCKKQNLVNLLIKSQQLMQLKCSKQFKSTYSNVKIPPSEVTTQTSVYMKSIMKYRLLVPSITHIIYQYNNLANMSHCRKHYPLSCGVPVWERYGSTLLPATREQHDQNCTQSH